MLKLEMIDPSKPLTLMPMTRAKIDDLEMVELADRLAMPQLLSVDEATEGATPLKIVETAGFIEWLRNSSWAARVEHDLQRLSQDEHGRPFLTASLKIAEFESLAADASAEPFGDSLQQAFGSWLALGATAVYFDGYQLCSSVPALG